MLLACESPDDGHLYSLSKEMPVTKVEFAKGISLRFYSAYSFVKTGTGITISDQDLRWMFNRQGDRAKAGINYSPGTSLAVRRPIRISISFRDHNSHKYLQKNCGRSKSVHKLQFCYKISRDEENAGSGGQEYEITGWAKIPGKSYIIFSATKQAEFTRPERVFDPVWVILSTLRY